MSEPTKHPTLYYSKSREEYVTLESLHAAHLEKAYRKLWREHPRKPHENEPMMECMENELRARGATVDGAGNVTWPPKEPRL